MSTLFLDLDSTCTLNAALGRLEEHGADSLHIMTMS